MFDTDETGKFLESGVICPLCRKRSPSGAASCASCGVDFMKWLRLQGGKAAAGKKAPRPRRGWEPFAAAAAAAALAVAMWRAGKTEARADAPAPVPVVSAEPEGSAMALSDIHSRALAEGRLYGVELMRDELERRYIEGGRAFSDDGLAGVAAELGMPVPQEQPLRDDEAAMQAKCLKDGAWSYGPLPARPTAGAQCWAAGSGYPRRWVRQHWNPKRKAWSAYAEPEAARAVRHILSTRFSPEREEAVRDAATLALARPEGDRRQALLAYYGFLAEREGALAALRRY